MTEDNRRQNIADFATAHNRLLGGLQSARQLADCDAAVNFSASDAEAELVDARRFAEEVRNYLRTEGLAGRLISAGLRGRPGGRW